MKDKKGKIIKCEKCESVDIRLAGPILRTDGVKVQRYQCKKCGHTFTLDHIKRRREVE